MSTLKKKIYIYIETRRNNYAHLLFIEFVNKANCSWCPIKLNRFNLIRLNSQTIHRPMRTANIDMIQFYVHATHAVSLSLKQNGIQTPRAVAAAAMNFR